MTDNTPDLVERVARAIATRRGSAIVQHFHRADAEAAIASLPTPTPIEQNDKLREALEIIAGDMSFGHCVKCKEPCGGATLCDCNAGWEPNDPVKIARDALSALVEEGGLSG